MPTRLRTRALLTLFLWPFAVAVTITASMHAKASAPPRADVKVVDVGDGISLHYAERGEGEPVVFVHGSLGDLGYWDDELAFFGRRYHAIAYSRRYDWPNDNPIRPGYSAVTDAADLAAFVQRLRLGRVNVIGHSYGALTALFLAVAHPELVKTLVLAEPPAVSLLNHAEGPGAADDRATFDDIQRRMVEPMKAAFARGDQNAGVAAFMTYVFNDPDAWTKMPPAARADTLKSVREWEATMTRGELFPELPPDRVRTIAAPALLLSGDRSYPFLRQIDQDLLRLLPRGRQRIVAGAGHQMWLQKPDFCRDAVLDFWRETGRD